MSTNSKDLSRRLAAGADDAPAILAPDSASLTHGGLRGLIKATAERLHALGIGRGDRVAIVLPNGPEMATAFVAVAGGGHDGAAQSRPTATRSSISTSPISAPRRSSWPRTRRARRSPWPSGTVSRVLRPARPARSARPAASPSSGDGGRPHRRRRHGRAMTTSRWCCTPRARHRGPRSCRCSQPTSRPRPAISARRCA